MHRPRSRSPRELRATRLSMYRLSYLLIVHTTAMLSFSLPRSLASLLLPRPLANTVGYAPSLPAWRSLRGSSANPPHFLVVPHHTGKQHNRAGIKAIYSTNFSNWYQVFQTRFWALRHAQGLLSIYRHIDASDVSGIVLSICPDPSRSGASSTFRQLTRTLVRRVSSRSKSHKGLELKTTRFHVGL